MCFDYMVMPPGVIFLGSNISWGWGVEPRRRRAPRPVELELWLDEQGRE